MVTELADVNPISSDLNISAMDLRLKPISCAQLSHKQKRVLAAADDGGEERYDSCGAMDLSSSCSGSALEDDPPVKPAANRRKRKASVDISDDEIENGVAPRKKMDSDSSALSSVNGKQNGVAVNGSAAANNQPKVRNTRKNIKGVLSVTQLNPQAKEAHAAEKLRLSRLQQLESSQQKYKESMSDEEVYAALVTDVEEEKEEEDPNNSGMHVNDALNVPNKDGKVLINIRHPDTDQDIFLAPQLGEMVKPHQIGGLRFLYDNIIESTSRYKESPGYGCILAHNMGLGKTLQIISFIDVFLENTDTKKVLCIVPINTIQNWLAEFNYWLPAQGEYSALSEKVKKIKGRKFQIYVLNDSLKNLAQRGAVINAWDRSGGVLLMGYELYRQLANRRHRRKRPKGPEFDMEEDNQSKNILEDVQTALVNPGPDLVICDEGHRIKNSHASISQALKQIKTKRRIVLTGYPLQNNLMEYWCMVDFVRPNYLGNKTEFTNMFERPIQNGQCIDSTPKDVRLMKHRAHVLHEQLKGFVQRRSHAVLKDSLPDKTEHVLFVRLTQIQRTLYKRFMEELISNRCVSNPLKAFAVCCKIWNHPDVLYNFLKKREEIDFDIDPEEYLDSKTLKVDGTGQPLPGSPEDGLQDGKKEEINYEWAQGMLNAYTSGQVEHSNKLQIFLAILEGSVRVGDRLLLFSQSLCTLNLIEQFLQKRTVPGQKNNWKPGVNYYRLDGSTSAQERERLINKFNADSEVMLFLVSTRAGSLGVNLVGANRVVIFDASWNPCHDTQAVCRVYRYGQDKETHIYRLVTDNSLEKKIYDRQINKQGMSDRIVDELNPDAHLSSKEVHSLICDEEEDPEPLDMKGRVNTLTDPVMKDILCEFAGLLTKLPICHESQLVDRKDNKLSNAEKKLAERAYKLEKTSKITYSRPSYAAFYPKQGTFATNLHNPGSNGFTRNRYFENGKKLDTWMPATSTYTSQTSSLVTSTLRQEKPFSPAALGTTKISGADPCSIPFPTPSFSNVLSAPPSGNKSLGNGGPRDGCSGTGSVASEDLNGSPGDWSKPTTSSYAAANKACARSLDNSVISRHSVLQPMAAPPAPPAKDSTSANKTTAAASSGGTNGSNGGSTVHSALAMMDNLSKQGIGIQEVRVPRELHIPTNPGEPPIRLAAGQNVLVIRTPKGMYLRMEEKIIKIKQHSTVSGLFTSGASSSSTGSGSESSDTDTTSVASTASTLKT